MTADETKMAIVVELANLTAQGLIEWVNDERTEKRMSNYQEYITKGAPAIYEDFTVPQYLCEALGHTYKLAYSSSESSPWSLFVDKVSLVDRTCASRESYPRNPFDHLHEAITGQTKDTLEPLEKLLEELRTLREDSPLANL